MGVCCVPSDPIMTGAAGPPPAAADRPARLSVMTQLPTPLLSIEIILHLPREAKPRRPALLILDAVPVGSDRDLAVFGNGFVARLASWVKDDRNVVVLCSCAPGQVSWTAEGQRCSVFG